MAKKPYYQSKASQQRSEKAARTADMLREHAAFRERFHLKTETSPRAERSSKPYTSLPAGTPPEKIVEHINRTMGARMVAEVSGVAHGSGFDEDAHPRDEQGKFTNK